MPKTFKATSDLVDYIATNQGAIGYIELADPFEKEIIDNRPVKTITVK